MRYKLLADHEAIQVGTGNGSNFNSSTVVRIFNADTTFKIVSVETSAAVLIGSIHVGAGSSIEIQKDGSDEIFLSGAGAVFGTAVAVNA